MNLEKRNNIPLCKFGPGGEYQNDWSMSQPVTNRSSSAIGKLLDIIAEMTGLTEEPQPLTKKQVINEAKQNNAKATSNSTISGRLSSQPTLFSDDIGIGSPSKARANNRVRTHRRVTKKRAANSCRWESTLFGVDFSSSKLA